jgi:hypothetical protein
MSNRPKFDRRAAILLGVAAAAGGSVLSATPAEASNWPRLDKALDEMKDAKKFLENAKDGFGGHKKKAIQALSAAITEIEAAIATGRN